MNADHVIETQDLTRYYNGKCVVDSLNLQVPRGCVFGFLGRNGSGKTTTIRMLLGLVQPTRGSSALFGTDSTQLTPALRARVGYLTEEHRVNMWMTVQENGHFQSQFYPQWNVKVFQSILDHFRLKPDAKAKDLSRGERAGLALALTLAPEPELMIMDDPALGLDPVARRALVESMLYITRRQDRTILFSTHILSDVERVADHIAILDQSVLRVRCPLEVFRERVRRYLVRFPGTPPDLSTVPGVLQSSRSNQDVRVTCVEKDQSVIQALRSYHPTSIEEVQLGLEEAFISYLGDRGDRPAFLSDN